MWFYAYTLKSYWLIMVKKEKEKITINLNIIFLHRKIDNLLKCGLGFELLLS